jgi:adenylylsulfate kinase-like enzyme
MVEKNDCCQKGFTLWFTGLPCSGKSAVADKVAEILKGKGMRVERLDGDIVRQDLTRDRFLPERPR